MAFTTGTWRYEKDVSADFDECIERSMSLFKVYREVPGTLIQPRPCQENIGVRIDRILIPTSSWWTLGAIGVELKRSDIKIGPPLSQLLDYSRSLFRLPLGINIALDWVFLWPAQKEGGPLASVCAQNRIGTAIPHDEGKINFWSGEENILYLDGNGGYTISPRAHLVGRKSGSR